MKIETKFFDEVEIEEENIIIFEAGIPGFEDYKKYIVMDINPNSNLKCIQSIEDKNVCLIITSPWNYFKDYEFELSDEEIAELEIEQESDVAVFNVLTFRESKITANLVAPIIINVIKNKGRQIILQNAKYDVRQELPC